MKKEKQVKKETKVQEPLVIRGFDIIEENMRVYFSDGRTTIVPYNKGNLEKIRNNMLERMVAVQEQLPKVYMRKVGLSALTLAGAAGIVLLNTTDIGKEFNTVFSNTVLGGITLLSGTGVVKDSKIIRNIRKAGIFVKHRAEINEAIVNNAYMYANISEKDKKRIQEWLQIYVREPIVVENLSDISYTTVKTIWDNIQLNKRMDFDYSEKGFQKTL